MQFCCILFCNKANEFLQLQHQFLMKCNRKRTSISRLPVIFAHTLVHTARCCSPKVTPSTANSRNHTSRALPSSRATHLSSSTRVSKATHHSSRVTVSRSFSCRGRHQLLVTAEIELVVADTNISICPGGCRWLMDSSLSFWCFLLFEGCFKMFCIHIQVCVLKCNLLSLELILVMS